MQDREPTYPGRVTLTPVYGLANTYDMERADRPLQEGTPLNKASLLKDATAALFGKTNAAVPDDILNLLSKSALAQMTEKYTKTTIGTFAVGKTITLNVGGAAKEFIVVNQGKPSSLYDDSCNGTWLLMKDCYEKRQWNFSNNNKLESSDINTYLNGTFLNLFDSNIKDAIKQVKIPYVNGTGGSAVASGANGLSEKIFLLSAYEVGWTTNDYNHAPVDGAKLSYFESGTGTSANNKRIANLNGSSSIWWLRSPLTNDTRSVWGVSTNGTGYNGIASESLGIRPALVLPSTFAVYTDSSGNAYTEQEYVTKITDVLGTELTIGPQIATGSYTGTGTYGASNPNSLTFEFEPKILLVLSNDATGGMLGIRAAQKATTGLATYQGRDNIAFNQNVVSWYYIDGGNSSTYPYIQMNQASMSYYYIAIG